MANNIEGMLDFGNFPIGLYEPVSQTAGWTETGIEISFAGSPLGFFEIVIVLTGTAPGQAMGACLRNSSGVAYTLAYTSGIGNPQYYAVQLVSHGWAISSPLAGYSYLVFARVTSQVSYSCIVGVILEDAPFTLETFNGSSSGTGSVQLFGYGAAAT